MPLDSWSVKQASSYVAAIRTADLATLGICPFLRFPSSAYNSYTGAKLVLPNDTNVYDEETGELEFDVVVNKERRVFTAYGAVGRGTTIVPVKAAGRAKQWWGAEELVVKIAWPPKMRDAEGYFIKRVRKQLSDHRSEYLKHVVDLKCSLIRSMQEMKLPRASMGDLRDFGLDNVEERVCRTLLKTYPPLELFVARLSMPHRSNDAQSGRHRACRRRHSKALSVSTREVPTRIRK
ncbi:hypothetical protein AcV7_001052 [Taiwanofungus camphoratus]|nr:hypothetical protein AcV7_001052 [Antrodia cinnamomea]